jgi:hypothetical protein
MKRMLAAKLAILHEFQSVRVIFLVFLCVVISLLALGACESNLDSSVIRHLAAPPILNLFDPSDREIRVPPSPKGVARSRSRVAHRATVAVRFSLLI